MVKRKVELQFEAEGAQQVSSAIAKIGSAATKTAGQAKTLERSGQRLGKSFAETAKTFILLPQAIVNTGRILSGLGRTLKAITIDFAKQGDSILDSRNAFNSWADTIGGATQVLRALKDATGDEISELNLQRGALGFATVGIKLNADQLSSLFNIVKRITDVTGRSFEPTIRRLSKAFAGGSLTSIAAAIGIDSLSRSEIAATIGAENLNKQLSTQEVIQFGLQLAQERATELNVLFGDSMDNAGDKASRFTAALENIKNDFISTVTENKKLNQAFEDLAVFLREVGLEGENAGEVLGKAVGDAVAFLVEIIPEAIIFINDLRASIIGLAADALTVIQEVARLIQDNRTLFRVLVPITNLISDEDLDSLANAQSSIRDLQQEQFDIATRSEDLRARLDEIQEARRVARQEAEDFIPGGPQLAAPIEFVVTVGLDDSSVAAARRLAEEQVGAKISSVAEIIQDALAGSAASGAPRGSLVFE